MEGTFLATSSSTQITEFSETPSGVPGCSATLSPGCGPHCPRLPHRPAAGRGRPRAAKRRGGWRAASVWSAAAGARYGSYPRGARVRRAQRRAQKPTRTAGTRRRRLCAPRLLPSTQPSAAQPSPASTPARDGARGRGAPTRAALSALGDAAAPGCAAAGRLLSRGSRYAQPGVGCRALRASSPVLCPPSCTTHPVCRSGDRRPALCWLRVVSLTWASSSLVDRAQRGSWGRGIWALGAPCAGGGNGDLVCSRGRSALSFNFDIERPGVGRLEQSNLPGRFRQRVGGWVGGCGVRKSKTTSWR